MIVKILILWLLQSWFYWIEFIFGLHVCTCNISSILVNVKIVVNVINRKRHEPNEDDGKIWVCQISSTTVSPIFWIPHLKGVHISFFLIKTWFSVIYIYICRLLNSMSYIYSGGGSQNDTYWSDHFLSDCTYSLLCWINQASFLFGFVLVLI